MLRAVNVELVKTEGHSENIAQILATPTDPPLFVGDKEKCSRV